LAVGFRRMRFRSTASAKNTRTMLAMFHIGFEGRAISEGRRPKRLSFR
jgi:hypothetical protein